MAAEGAGRFVGYGVAGLLALLLFVSGEAVYANAPTVDEPYHLAFGGRVLELGQVVRDRYYHDGLMPWSALPAAVAGVGPDGPTELAQLRAARWVTVGTLLGLGALLGAAAAWRTGRKEAALAAGLPLLAPNLLAHGSLATTDVPSALWTLLAAVGALGLVVEGRWRWAGVFAGGLLAALLTKYSALLVGLCLAAGVLAAAPRRWPRLLAALAAVWLGLFLLPPSATVASRGVLVSQANAVLDAWGPARTHLPASDSPVPVPLPRSYALGLTLLEAHSRHGHPGFLRGEWHERGRLDYFAWMVALKMPLAAVLASLGALAVLARRRHLEDGLLLAPALIYFVLASASSLHLGVRHLLLVVPLVQLWAVVKLAAWRPPPGRGGLLAGLAAALLLFTIFEVACARPRYLSFLGAAWGGPTQAWRHVGDSNLQWGQEDWLIAAVPDVQVRPREPVAGRVAISAADRQAVDRPFAWVEAGELVQRVGDTWFVFEVPPPAPPP